MKVVYTRDSQIDLLKIHEWIHKDNSQRATSFIDELEEACETLSFLPLGFPIVFSTDSGSVRRRVYGNYLIFYRAELDKVVVLRVGHAAQDWSESSFT
jgi:toxin ParE1/3/4